MSIYVEQFQTPSYFKNSDSWTILSKIEACIKSKIEAIGKPLKEWDININRGILTGLNEAFIISTETRNSLIAADPKSAEIIRPILRGRDIKRYTYTFAELWLIATFPSRHYDIDDYPAIKEHLLSYGIERLEQTGLKHIVNGLEIKARKKTSNKWFETQDSINYWNDFSKRKIMYNDICQKLSFALVPENIFCVNTVYFIKDTPDLTYLLACLNSKVTDWYYRTLSVQLGAKAVRMFSIYVEQLPIPKLEGESYTLLSQLADSLVSDGEPNSSDINNQIDQILYDAYGFSEEEIKLIEESYN